MTPSETTALKQILVNKSQNLGIESQETSSTYQGRTLSRVSDHKEIVGICCINIFLYVLGIGLWTGCGPESRCNQRGQDAGKAVTIAATLITGSECLCVLAVSGYAIWRRCQREKI